MGSFHHNHDPANHKLDSFSIFRNSGEDDAFDKLWKVVFQSSNANFVPEYFIHVQTMGKNLGSVFEIPHPNSQR